MKLLHKAQSSRYLSSNQQNFYVVTQKYNFGILRESLTNKLYCFFYVLLTVHISTISVINQLDAQNLVL